MNPLLDICLLFCSWFLFSDSAVARYAPLRSLASGPAFAPLLGPVTQPSPGTVAPISAGVPHHARHLDTQLILSIVFASAAFAAILLGFLGICFYRRKNNFNPDSNATQTRGKFSSSKTVRKGSVSSIDHALLQAATNNFSESNILGEGGFGCVYKACMDDGILVAVKKMENGGEDFEREFENEMDLLCRIRHPNIVSLLGYSNDGQTRFLIYELMENGSLESQLHGPSNGSALTWHIRMKIALDAARGLEYLHEHCNPPVIHRDLKSSNILLDSEFNAKISDFGLAVTGQSKGSVKLSGTLGYVAPEYLLDGKLTEKSDVYAFGVVLLELLMGRKPVEK